MPRPRARFTLVLAAALGVGALSAGLAPVAAQTPSLEDARAQRDATIAERAEAAQQLQVLTAQESELRAALDSLDQALVVQADKLASAEVELGRAEETAARRQQEADETAQRIDGLRQQAAATVVKEYISATGGHGDDLLVANDANEYVQRRHLLSMVEGNYHDDLDQLRALIEDQRRLEAEAAAALAEAARLRDEVAVVQAELAEQREAQGRVEAELQGRIVDFEAKVAELDAAEAQLNAVISAHQVSVSSSASSSSSSSSSSAAPARAASVSGGAGYIWPADGSITSGFGYRRHPVLGTSRLHAGLDIGAGYGSPVWAAKGGVVILSGWNGGYGYCVMIDHGDGVVTLYGHMSELYVSEGESVSQGSVVGLVGSTGMSTGPHLHFETRVGGSPEDPLYYVG